MEGKNRKAYLIAFIDDMSRLICHAQFYLSEKLDCYLDCLRQALLTRGLPRKLYLDNGPAFRSFAPKTDLRLVGHRPGPLQALPAAGTRQDRALLSHAAQ